MNYETLKDRAVEYYACYIWHLFPANASLTSEDLVGMSRIEDFVGNHTFRLSNPDVMLRALSFLAHKEVINYIADDFGPDIISLTGDIDGLPSDPASPFSKYRLAADAGGNWIGAAIDNLNRKLDAGASEDEQARGEETIEISDADHATADSAWEPIKLDRTNPEVDHAIEVTEKALEVIEQNNGYAVTEPEERNGIVKAMRGNLEAIKEGTPSKSSIRESLVKPLQYLARKFSDSAMGEFAKIAVAALIKAFFS